MPYPQDLVGKFVNYRIDPGGTVTDAMRRGFVRFLLPGQTTPATLQVYAPPAPAGPVMGGHRPPPLTMGTHRQQTVNGVALTNTNTPWSFNFLKYQAGAVTIAPLNAPVLTGPMSGCYLCHYTENGGLNLAHIGTANAVDSADSLAAKAAWRAFVALPGVTGVQGASPFDYFPTSEFQAAMMSPSAIPQVCGYFANGQAYAMLVAPVPASMAPGAALLKIVSVKPMTMQPWSAIAALRTFRM